MDKIIIEDPAMDQALSDATEVYLETMEEAGHIF